MNARIQRHASGNTSQFELYVDDVLICYTTDDDAGMQLMIALNKLQLRAVAIDPIEVLVQKFLEL
jgi:hypothetical protein